MSFEKIKLIRPRRSVFRENNTVRTTIRIGQVIPSMWREMVPGDTFYSGQVAQVELMPLVAPTKGDLYLESCLFFVAYDTLAIGDESKFTDILATITDVSQAVPIPKWSLDKTDLDSDSKMKDTHLETLWDKFGFPLNLPATLDDEVKPIAYLQRAYNLCYNEYVRDENLDTEVSLENNEILTCCYKKDLFTSAFTSPQKGDPVYIPLSGTASTSWSDDILNTVVGIIKTYETVKNYGSGGTATHVTYPGAEVTATTTPNSTSGSISINNGPYSVTGTAETGHGTENLNSKLGVSIDQALLNLLNNNSVDLTHILTFDIEQLRVANKLQKWLERNQLAGSRTKEYLLANYGIAPSDETLQRPVFLGRLRTPIMVSSVTSSVETTNTPQGTKTGNGIGTNAVKFKSWTCKEPGLLLALSFIRPKAAYSQGINRQWIKKTIYDYFNPIFANLGQQEIYNAEIYAQGTSADKQIFGYTERNQELKTVPDVVSGNLRSGISTGSLRVWSISRQFNSLPALDSEFIHVNPSDYDYLFSLSDYPHAVVTFHNIVKAIRPVPKFSQGTL